MKKKELAIFSTYKDDLGEEFYSRKKPMTPGKQYFMEIKKSNAINKICDIINSLEKVQENIKNSNKSPATTFPNLAEQIEDLEIIVRDAEIYDTDND